MHYFNTMPIQPYHSTPWLVEFSNGYSILCLWHKDAKVENVVESVKATHPEAMFTVMAIDVGEFVISRTVHSIGNGRKVDQNLNVVV